MSLEKVTSITKNENKVVFLKWTIEWLGSFQEPPRLKINIVNIVMAQGIFKGEAAEGCLQKNLFQG